MVGADVVTVETPQILDSDSRRHWDTGTGGHSPVRTGPHHTPGTAIRQCNDARLLMWCNNVKKKTPPDSGEYRGITYRKWCLYNINNLYKQAGEGREGIKMALILTIIWLPAWQDLVQLYPWLPGGQGPSHRAPCQPALHWHAPDMWSLWNIQTIWNITGYVSGYNVTSPLIWQEHWSAKSRPTVPGRHRRPQGSRGNTCRQPCWGQTLRHWHRDTPGHSPGPTAPPRKLG